MGLGSRVGALAPGALGCGASGEGRDETHGTPRLQSIHLMRLIMCASRCFAYTLYSIICDSPLRRGAPGSQWIFSGLLQRICVFLVAFSNGCELSRWHFPTGAPPAGARGRSSSRAASGTPP